MTKTTQTRTSDAPLAFGLGSNVGDREAILGRAIDELRRLFGPLRIAPLYRSAPLSPIAQPDFLNTVALAPVPQTRPVEILALVKALEQRCGRRGGVRWGPRPLDIDLLLCGNEQCRRPELTLPHPRLRERRFVLEPLARIAPGLCLPPDGAAVGELLKQVADQVLEEIPWPAGQWL